MNKFAIALFVVGLAGALATPFEDCSSSYTLKEVRVEGCTASPCIVHRGTSLNVAIDFEATFAATELNVNAYGNITGIWVPIPSYIPPGCDTLTVGDCPMEVGEAVIYSVEVFIEKLWPAVSVIGKGEIRDENNALLVCFLIPVTVV